MLAVVEVVVVVVVIVVVIVVYANESDPRSNVHYLSNIENMNFFFRSYFHYCSSSAYYCEDHFHSRLYPQFKYMTFIYS